MSLRIVLSILLLSVISSYADSVNGGTNDNSGWENIFAYNRSTVIPLRHYGDKTYFIGYHIKATYIQATQFCNNIHMKLLTITSEEESNRIYKFIRDSKPGGYWTSGSRLLDGSSWVWMSYGVNIDYTKWAPGQPDNIQEKCLQVNPQNGDLYWNDINCDALFYFICERYEPKAFDQYLDTQTSRWDNLMARSSVSANIGLLHFGNKKYFFGKLIKGSYLQAIQFCRIINMQLVSITSQEENDRISKYIRDTHAGETWWSSGSKLLDSKTWIWLTKAKPVEYTNWLPGEPDNDDQLCLQLVHDNNRGLMWADDYCNSQNKIICENFDDDDIDIDPTYNWGQNRARTPTLTRRPFPSTPSPESLLNDQQWEEFLKTTTADAFVFRYHGGKKYHVEMDKVATQKQASRFCEFYGMQLFEVNDARENAELKWLVLDTGVEGPYWLGAKKINGVWTWPRSQKSLSYTNWDIAKPSRRQDRNCLLVNDVGKWSDENCDQISYFICEVQMPVGSSTFPGASNEQCSQPVVNVYVNTNLVTEDGQNSLSKYVLSTKDVSLSDSGYQVQVNNNIDVAKGSSSSNGNTNNDDSNGNTNINGLDFRNLGDLGGLRK